MPDLISLFTLGRYAVAAYATAATVLTTACLALQFLTVIDRRSANRRTRASRSDRPLFLPLETPSLPS